MSSLLAYFNLSTGVCTFLIALALPSVSHPHPFSCKEIQAHMQHYCVFLIRQNALAALSRITDVKTSIWILASAMYGSKHHLRARSQRWCRAGSPCPHLTCVSCTKRPSLLQTPCCPSNSSHCCRLQVCWGLPV